MTRSIYIERILRQIYGGYIPQDSSITENLVNTYLNEAIGVANAAFKSSTGTNTFTISDT